MKRRGFLGVLAVLPVAAVAPKGEARELPEPATIQDTPEMRQAVRRSVGLPEPFYFHVEGCSLNGHKSFDEGVEWSYELRDKWLKIYLPPGLMLGAMDIPTCAPFKYVSIYSGLDEPRKCLVEYCVGNDWSAYQLQMSGICT